MSLRLRLAENKNDLITHLRFRTLAGIRDEANNSKFSCTVQSKVFFTSPLNPAYNIPDPPPPHNPAHFFAKHLILVPPQTRGGSSAGPPFTCIAILTDNRQWSSFYLYIPRPAAIQPLSRCNRADHGVFASGTEILILFITAPSPRG